MALLQPAGRAPLFIVMSSIRSRYGIMASTTSFRISPGILSGNIDLLFLIAATLFLITLISEVKGSSGLAHCISGMLCWLLNTEE